MASLFKHSKLHQTYHQTKKIRRQLRKLNREGVSRCIVVGGYPKSGNTWLARMVADIAGCELLAYLTDVKEKLPREIGSRDQPAANDTIVTKSHHMLPLLRYGGIPQSNIALIIRDPRDIAVSGSGFLFRDRNEPTSESIDQMIDMMVESTKPSVKWDDMRWDEFVQRSLHDTVPVIRYVDLINDTRGTLMPVLQHLGLNDNENLVDRVIAFHTFERSKQRSEERAETSVSHHLRSGKPGEYKKYLTDRQRERIESEFRPLMERFGFL